MSLKRSQIKEILSKAGVSAENMDTAIEEIITGHNATVDALKDDIADLKTNSQNYTDIKTKFDAQSTELENVKAQLAEMEDYKGRYESTKAEYDKFKLDIDGKEKKAKSDIAVKKVLMERGNYKDGNITNIDELVEEADKEWSEYKGTIRTEGAKTANPPSMGGKSTKTKAEIMAIKDPVERQQAIKENLDLFE